MNTALRGLCVSASDLATFGDCPARYYHAKQDYRTGLLPTDRVAAGVSLAVHDALMVLHREVELAFDRRRPLPAATARDRLDRILIEQLREHRLRATDVAVRAQLSSLSDGLDRAVELIVGDMSAWAVDRDRCESMVWVEAPLDHGPRIQAVELAPGYLVRTRPDVIGLRDTDDGRCRGVVRDFKARGEVVNPAFDDGVLVRAIWVMTELQNPRCRWFVAGRSIQADTSGVELETVNLKHAASEDFHLWVSLSAEELPDHRERIMETMERMDQALGIGDPELVPANPGGLCLAWCAYLGYCQAGQAHVRKYHGPEALADRLGVH
ncbi:MAG: PD-(D/E)XK nuclease family protein [Chloroflexota bacterium]